MNRQTYRQTEIDKLRKRYRGKDMNGALSLIQTNRQTDRMTHRYTGRRINMRKKKKDRQTVRQTDWGKE